MYWVNYIFCHSIVTWYYLLQFSVIYFYFCVTLRVWPNANIYKFIAENAEEEPYLTAVSVTNTTSPSRDLSQKQGNNNISNPVGDLFFLRSFVLMNKSLKGGTTEFWQRSNILLLISFLT